MSEETMIHVIVAKSAKEAKKILASKKASPLYETYKDIQSLAHNIDKVQDKINNYSELIKLVCCKCKSCFGCGCGQQD